MSCASATMITVRWRRKLDNKSLERAIVTRVDAQLRGAQCGSGPLADVTVKTVFSYGAVDIDPKHLVVWIILEGTEAEQVPPWYRPYDGPSLVPGTDIDADIERWLLRLSNGIRQRFEQAKWPTGSNVCVCVEVDSRVTRGGGWHYFK